MPACEASSTRVPGHFWLATRAVDLAGPSYTHTKPSVSKGRCSLWAERALDFPLVSSPDLLSTVIPGTAIAP